MDETQIFKIRFDSNRFAIHREFFLARVLLLQMLVDYSGRRITDADSITVFANRAHETARGAQAAETLPSSHFIAATPLTLHLTHRRASVVYEARAGNRKVTHAAIRQTTGKPFTLRFDFVSDSDYHSYRAG
jgi:hypothetical protein